jgi:hypothetical protein
MHTWLRITLLAVCTAVGVAVAMAVAIHKPAEPNVAAEQAVKAPAPPVEPVKPVIVPPVEPVIAPYRDPIARQVGQLEESIQQLEESSWRRPHRR